MSSLNLLQTGLLLHIIGLSTLTGVTFASYITLMQFRKYYILDKQKGLAIMEATSKLAMVAGMGLLLQIISGVMMMVATSGVYGEQLWFQIKMVLVLLIIVGNTAVTWILRKRLRILVLEDITHGNKTGQISNLISRTTYLQFFLLLLFLIIFILSIFRFQ